MTQAAPPMPPRQYARVGDIRLAFHEAGPRSGVPVVLCHGFPELAFSWRHQIRALADAGYRVVVPDQRGYGASDRPDDVAAYDMAHLTRDLTGLLDHLGIDRAIFCGHDWGGLVVWQMPLMHPQRTAGVIGVNTPFRPRPPTDPVATLRRLMGHDMYIVHFQTPGDADALLAADPRRVFDCLMRRPPADATAAASGVTDPAGTEGGFALVRWIQAWDPARDTRERFLTEAELEVFVDTFARTGFTGGINWYRNLSRNWQRSAHLPGRVEVPALMVMAEKDPFLPPAAADGMARHVPDLEKVLLRGVGHWTQQEAPDRLATVLIDWLRRRFPPRAAASPVQSA
ncbi:alpha/beta fold hydrolase [Coralloluteibacterium thermophilus]|uniref:Alpha/beta fold hydrolase n=1 Tax=Coralloluteibacterium thermophilum TaxID=2707049 RepID=A0ABV9NLK9_9GAMM